MPEFPTDWTSYYLQQPNVPRRLVAKGYFARFVWQTLLAPANVITAAAESAVLGAQQTEPESPDDVLPVLGIQDNLPRYPRETTQGYRDRLTDKWEVWGAAGTNYGVVGQLNAAGFANASLAFNLPGGGNYFDDDGDPIFNVPPYPPSSLWWSQFAINIVLDSGSIGSGADGFSILLNPSDIATIRAISNRFKPAKYVLREIMVQVPNANDTRYDVGDLYDNGELYDQPFRTYIERFAPSPP